MATELTPSFSVVPSGNDAANHIFGSVASAISHIAVNHTDLVSLDKYVNITISGDWSGGADTNEFNTYGGSIVQDVTRYISIATDASNRASKSWDADKYVLDITSKTEMDYGTRIDGLQIKTSDIRAFRAYHGGRLSNLLIDACNLAVGSCQTIYQDAGDLYLWNVYIFNLAGEWISEGLRVAGGNCYAGNCIIIGGDNAIPFRCTGGTLTTKNCYGKGRATYVYTDVTSKVTCASSDETGSTGLQNVAYNTTQFVNVTPGSENFALPGAGSALYRTGTDTSGDSSPMDFATDIDGNAYYDTGGVRSIGPAEYVDSSNSIVQVINE